MPTIRKLPPELQSEVTITVAAMLKKNTIDDIATYLYTKYKNSNRLSFGQFKAIVQDEKRRVGKGEDLRGRKSQGEGKTLQQMLHERLGKIARQGETVEIAWSQFVKIFPSLRRPVKSRTMLVYLSNFNKLGKGKVVVVKDADALAFAQTRQRVKAVKAEASRKKHHDAIVHSIFRKPKHW